MNHRLLATLCIVLSFLVSACQRAEPKPEASPTTPVPPRSIPPSADPTPRDVLDKAIQAHGGRDAVMKTLIGKVQARATFRVPPQIDSAITWDESFDLPRRYRRTIKGVLNEAPFTMAFAVTNKGGWSRTNAGEILEFPPAEISLYTCWNAMLATLPSLQKDAANLKTIGSRRVGNIEAVGIQLSLNGDSTTLYFDRDSGRLARADNRIPHAVTRQMVDAEIVFGDYKDVSGVQFPMRITTSAAGETILDLRIMEIQWLDKIDDSVFDKP